MQKTVSTLLGANVSKSLLDAEDSKYLAWCKVITQSAFYVNLNRAVIGVRVSDLLGAKKKKKKRKKRKKEKTIISLSSPEFAQCVNEYGTFLLKKSCPSISR